MPILARYISVCEILSGPVRTAEEVMSLRGVCYFFFFVSLLLDPGRLVRGDAFEHWGNHIPRGLGREAPEGCSLHRHRSSAKR